ncbi:VWA domain-containing protein [Hoeflea sp.]|uniref:vWA domain-containing protein n=1 Tax=Hoeflea sp. TaxID=1940281 RepID=UPI003749581D
MEFLWPWAFLLLPLPFAVRYFLRPVEASPNGALRVPFYRRLLAGGNGEGRRSVVKPWRLLMASLIWILLVSALARPVVVGDQIPLPLEGRDLMMAIDLSGSMEREDFGVNGQPTNRLAVVKAAADDFISRRDGDRLGLIMFSNRAYLQAPLTFDRTVVRSLLDEAQVGLTGQETAIGDAIAIAAKRLKERPAENRVLVLLTDGASNAGVMQPLQAAELARELGIRIYTIGVGGSPRAVRTAFGQQIVDPAQNLDEATLTKIAEMTGGRYFRATDVKSLAGIYSDLDKLEPVTGAAQFVRPSVSLFFWPLGLGLVLTFAFSLFIAWPHIRARTSGLAPEGVVS